MLHIILSILFMPCYHLLPSNAPAIINCYAPTHARRHSSCSSLVQNYRISNTSALAHGPRSQNVGHNKFQLVYTYFYKHLKIITLTFSLCCAHSTAHQGRAGQDRPEQTPVPDSRLAGSRHYLRPSPDAGLMTLN